MWHVLIWKEWRQMRGMWLVLAIGGTIALLGVWLVGMGPDAWAGGMPAGLLATCVLLTTAFTSERMAGTERLLTRLPGGAAKVWLAKVGVNVVGGGALTVVLALLSLLILTPRQVPLDLGPFVVAAIVLWPSCLLWAGMIRKGILGLILGMVTGALLGGFWYLSAAPWLTFLPGPEFLLATIGAILVIAFGQSVSRWTPRSRRWRRWMTWPPIVVAALVWAAAFWWLNWGSVPMVPRPFDVEAYLAADVPPERNAAPLYRKAVAASPLVISHRSDDEPLWVAYDRAIHTEKPWPEVAEDAATVLAACERTLELARSASLMPEAEFLRPRDRRIDSFQDIVADTRDLARLMWLKARQLYHAGRPAEAAEWLLAMMRMGQHVQQRGAVIEYLIGGAVDVMACNALIRILDSPEWTADALRHVSRELRRRQDVRAALADCLKVEYLTIWSFVVDGEAFSDELGVSGFGWGIVNAVERKKNKAHLNAFYGAAMKAVVRPWHELIDLQDSEQSWDRVRAFERYVNRHVSHLRTMAGGFWGQSLQQVYAGHPRRQVRVRAVELAVALATYRAERGDYPARLDALVPDYLPAVPRDPLARGEPFGYRQIPVEGIRHERKLVYRGAGEPVWEYRIQIDAALADAGPKAWVLYSVGFDDKDDGGFLSTDYDPEHAGDWLVHLPDQPIPPQPDEDTDVRRRRMNSILGHDPNF